MPTRSVQTHSAQSPKMRTVFHGQTFEIAIIRKKTLSYLKITCSNNFSKMGSYSVMLYK